MMKTGCKIPGFGALVRIALIFGFITGGTNLHAEVTQYERQIIASVLVLEAANQGESGMLAVLHVINNRANQDPSRAVGQVARRKAFSCLNDITSQQHPDYGPAIRRAMRDRTWPQALEMVDSYVAGQLGEDFTEGATHYCISPPRLWEERMLFTKRIGAHSFFKEI